MKFRYFLATQGAAVQKGDHFWDNPLPVNRHQFAGTPGATTAASITYGQYFNAAHRFLCSDAGLAALAEAYVHQWAMAISRDDVDSIDIFLAKHGQYYHPARIEVTAKRRKTTLVLNVAISPEGCDCLANDYQTIQKLQHIFPYDFLPRIFGQATSGSVAKNRPIRFGLGQWLDDYHEFHLAPDATRIVVWHTTDAPVLLSEDATRAIFEQATRILTAYYNLVTFEHIFSWHHAAGDFVVNTDSNQVSVRLTTVRQYVPIFGNGEADIEGVFHALLLFLLSTSIRMRLDRLEGVGDFVWAEDIALEGTVVGFWSGLQVQADAEIIPLSLIDQFHSYMGQLSDKDLYELLDSIVKRTYAKMPELPIVQRHLVAHAAVLKAWLTAI